MNPSVWGKTGTLFAWASLACIVMELLTRNLSRGSRADLSLVHDYVDHPDDESEEEIA